MSTDPIVSNKQMPSSEVPRQLLILLVELLRSQHLPDLVINGAWARIPNCILGRPELAHFGIDLGLCELAVEQLRTLGSPTDAVSISRGQAGRAYTVLNSLYQVCRAYAGQEARPDLEAFVSSGCFDFCVAIVEAFASAGIDGLLDTHHGVLNASLCNVAICNTQPGCEGKIRSVATALTFCLEHSLDWAKDMGMATSGTAARICCGVFGRDEGGSEFTFTVQHIRMLTEAWSSSIRATDAFRAATKPSADSIFAAQLCVSDKVSDSSRLKKPAPSF